MNSSLLPRCAKTLMVAGMMAFSPAMAAAVSIMSPSGSFTSNGPDIGVVDIDSVPFTNMAGIPVRLSGTVSASAGTLEALESLLFGFSLAEDDNTIDLPLEKPFDENPLGNGGSSSGILESIDLPVGDTAFLVFRDSAPSLNPGDVLNTNYQVDVAPVPLPAGIWLLLSGSGMLLLTKRWQARAAA